MLSQSIHCITNTSGTTTSSSNGEDDALVVRVYRIMATEMEYGAERAESCS